MTTSHRPSDGRKPVSRKADRRRQLLTQARQLFGRLGYGDTTEAMVATAAGVSEAVFFQHYDNKKALFVDMLREVREEVLRRWRGVQASPGDPLARLHAIAETCLDPAGGLAVELDVLHRALRQPGDEDTAAELRRFYLTAEGILAQIIAEGQQTGVFRRSLDPRVGAWQLFRVAVGHALTAPLGIPLYEEPDYPARALDCLLHGLLKTDV